jgi:hypothetical protein
MSTVYPKRDIYISLQNVALRTVHGCAALRALKEGYYDEAMLDDLLSAATDVIEAHHVSLNTEQASKRLLPRVLSGMSSDVLGPLQAKYSKVREMVLLIKSGQRDPSIVQETLRLSENLLKDLRSLRASRAQIPNLV